MKLRISTAALAGLLTIGLSACGGQEKPRVDSSGFENIGDLRGALEEAGIACEGEDVSEAEQYEAQACGNGFYLTFYTDAGFKNVQVEEWAGEDELTTAVGANWAVRAKNGEQIEHVAEALDGKVIGGEAPEDAEGSDPASPEATNS